MNVIFLEYPYRFQRRLPPQTEVNEGGRVEFEVQVQEEEAEVHWFSDDVEIHPEKSRQDKTGFSTSEQHFVLLSRVGGPSPNLAFPRTAKIQAHKEGKKRSLVIRKCEVDDSARITARTNVDESETVFMVKCK